MKTATLAAAALLLLAPFRADAGDVPIPIVSAQSFYGEVAAAVGGNRVTVESVPVSPDADPHDFSPSPSVARAIADATIIVFNGAGYDHWMDHLLHATATRERIVIEAAVLVGVGQGDNPHIWYDPRTMPAMAAALAEALGRLDPTEAEAFEERRQAFVATLAPIDDKVAAIKGRFEGTLIAATEPVFGPMADALGLTTTNQRFQTAIMNETEPSARDIAAVIDDIANGRVKALIYNTQVADAMTDQLVDTANRADVPVVGVTETNPDGQAYADWMLGQLDALENALAGPSS
jgi:zinc/manganese transport system substrate-binding protein